MNSIKQIAMHSFISKYMGFNPKKNIQGLPKNYFLRLLFFSAGYIFFSMFFYQVMTNNAELFLKQNRDNMYFFMFGITISIMTLLFSLFKLISTHFKSNDNMIALTLPIKAEEIFLGNFIGTAIADIDNFIYLTISLIVYFSYRDLNITTILLSFISFIPMYIIPFAIANVLAILLAKFFNAISSKLKSLRYIVLYTLLGIVFYKLITNNGGERLITNNLLENIAYNYGWLFFNAKIY